MHSDWSSLAASAAVHNNQLAFSILERELGISPVMSACDFANSGQIDKLSMVLYLTEVQNAFTVPAKPKRSGMGFFLFVFVVFFLFKIQSAKCQTNADPPHSHCSKQAKCKISPLFYKSGQKLLRNPVDRETDEGKNKP